MIEQGNERIGHGSRKDFSGIPLFRRVQSSVRAFIVPVSLIAYDNDDAFFPTMLMEIMNMGVPKLKPRYTVDQYLASERASEERHIYCDGDIYAMAGVGRKSSIIASKPMGAGHTSVTPVWKPWSLSLRFGVR